MFGHFVSCSSLHLCQRQVDSPQYERDESFVTNRAGSVPNSTFDRWFRKWVNRAGVDHEGYRLHDLGHSVTTNWIRSGLNLVEMKYLVGHTNLESTSRYLHHAMEETRSKIDKI